MNVKTKKASISTFKKQSVVEGGLMIRALLLKANATYIKTVNEKKSKLLNKNFISCM